MLCVLFKWLMRVSMHIYLANCDSTHLNRVPITLGVARCKRGNKCKQQGQGYVTANQNSNLPSEPYVRPPQRETPLGTNWTIGTFAGPKQWETSVGCLTPTRASLGCTRKWGTKKNPSSTGMHLSKDAISEGISTTRARSVDTLKVGEKGKQTAA